MRGQHTALTHTCWYRKSRAQLTIHPLGFFNVTLQPIQWSLRFQIQDCNRYSFAVVLLSSMRMTCIDVKFNQNSIDSIEIPQQKIIQSFVLRKKSLSINSHKKMQWWTDALLSVDEEFSSTSSSCVISSASQLSSPSDANIYKCETSKHEFVFRIGISEICCWDNSWPLSTNRFEK